MARPHPRSIGWIGTTALAMGGSNQSLFLIAALFAGQDGIPGQGSAAVPLLVLGLLLSFAAAPGWTELVLLSPDRVGGISAACTAAFRPYSSILSALAGVCYWWGWVPTCGVTALLSANAINQWCLPFVPVPLLACALVTAFTIVNLCGVRWVSALAIPVAAASATLAFVSMLAPVLAGTVDWQRAADFHLTTPFDGWFGGLTSLMAGLYLVGFGAPAFEAAACHVGETRDVERNLPRAMVAGGAMATVYFLALPVVWLGAVGPEALGHDLSDVLGPTFAPLFGAFGKAAAIGFMMFNMFHGTLQPLAGAARTLSQLAEDGLAPRALARRLATDAPWVATLATAGFAILFLLIGDPIWLIAAANFTYLIGIGLPSVAVWLLRRDDPGAHRPYRAPRGTIGLGLAAACVWGCSALLGFEQFGLRTVLIGLLMAYSGAGLYAWRKLEDRRRSGMPGLGRSLHVKLTGAMLLVLALDGAGYMLAVDAIPAEHVAFVTALEDIFVAVAVLTISVGIVLPGMIAHSADQMSKAARRLAFGTVEEFARAMNALGEGRLEAAHASVETTRVTVRGHDELGAMAASFNVLLDRVGVAALGLDRAREGLSAARTELMDANAALARTVEEERRLTGELRESRAAAIHDASFDGLTQLPNRTLFIARLDRALTEHRNGRASPFAVLFVDLDRFKMVNDSLGHVAGNQLIVQVAGRIERLLRSAGDGGRALAASHAGSILARLGGDEFSVLLQEVGEAGQALAVAAAIQDCFAAPFEILGQDVHASASIGIALSGEGHVTPAEMLRDADLAMYRAKALGKARAELYDISLHANARQRLTLENSLRRALREGEFVLHYQPIVRMGDGGVAGFEALVRWNHPERGLIGPGAFIDLAEETGLIVPLGSWVLREACRQLVGWRGRGAGAPLFMSINISPRQFAQAELVAEVSRVLAETGADPCAVKLEITESGTMGDPVRATRVLADLKAIGVHLSLDDFGTGYSSLSHLHRFPVDVLKIDRSFVAGLLHDDDSRQIVQTIMLLAASKGLEVVAEGIETEAQAAEVKRIGCQFGQGYHYGRPLPAECAMAMLDRSAVGERIGVAA